MAAPSSNPSLWKVEVGRIRSSGLSRVTCKQWKERTKQTSKKRTNNSLRPVGMVHFIILALEGQRQFSSSRPVRVTRRLPLLPTSSTLTKDKNKEQTKIVGDAFWGASEDGLLTLLREWKKIYAQCLNGMDRLVGE